MVCKIKNAPCIVFVPADVYQIVGKNTSICFNGLRACLLIYVLDKSKTFRREKECDLKI